MKSAGTAVLLVMLTAMGAAAARGAGMDGAAAEPAASSAAAPGTLATAQKKLTCREKWKRYRASQACFDRYRLVRGGLKPEAFKYCKQIKEPKLCE